MAKRWHPAPIVERVKKRPVEETEEPTESSELIEMLKRLYRNDTGNASKLRGTLEAAHKSTPEGS